MYTPSYKQARPVTVSQLNFVVNSLLTNDERLKNILVEGQISNIKYAASGHVYFTLKDAKAAVACVIYRQNMLRLRQIGFVPENDMKVICRGSVALYEANGTYQIRVTDLQPDGIGALALAYEQLKARLEGQGLFSASAKKPIPRMPKTVGIITSPTGAVIQDMLKVLYKRCPTVDAVFYPVAVQGADAPPQLINALRSLDESGLCDVIIIGRGGGSMEDLWAFNDEGLAYTIYQCKTPVISAVGHQTDYTICDFTADLRAATPSEAAELAVPDIRDVKAAYLSKARVLSQLINRRLLWEQNRFTSKQNRVNFLSPQQKYQRMEKRFKDYQSRLLLSLANRMNNEEAALKSRSAKLESLNPLAVMSRGFALAEQDGKIITGVGELDKEREFSLTLADKNKLKVKVTGE